MGACDGQYTTTRADLRKQPGKKSRTSLAVIVSENNLAMDSRFVRRLPSIS
jgi:hypothetical protein